MQSVLHAIWCGDLHPQESGVLAKEPFKSLHRRLVAKHAAVDALLNKEQQEKLEELFSLHYEFDGLVEEAMFSYGFRLGVTLLGEAFFDETVHKSDLIN